MLSQIVVLTCDFTTIPLTAEKPNQDITPKTRKHLRQVCKIDPSGQDLLRHAIDVMNLSGRAYDRILRVPRTITDLEESEKIETHHLAEAIQHRRVDGVKGTLDFSSVI